MPPKKQNGNWKLTKLTLRGRKTIYIGISNAISVNGKGELMWQLCAAMMSWVGCLLTDSVLPDKWKLREWEFHWFWEGFGYFLQIR